MMVRTILRNALEVLAVVGALALLSSAAPAAEVEWELLKSLNTGAPPLDVAVSADGRSIFVLTEDGQILMYGGEGTPPERIAVGPQAERIAVDPDGERLYVTNRPNKRVDVILVDWIRDINVSGAPYKGHEKAPVVISVFSDFQ